MIKTTTICDQCKIKLPVEDFEQLESADLSIFHQHPISFCLMPESVIFVNDNSIHFDLKRRLDFCSYNCLFMYVRGNAK